MKLVQLWVLGLGLCWGLVCWGEQGAKVDPGEGYFHVQDGQFFSTNRGKEDVNPEKAFQQWQFDRAVGGWEKRLMELSPESSPEEYIDVSVQLAEVYQMLGRLQMAFEVLQRAESYTQKITDSRHQVEYRANILAQLGDVYLAKSNVERKECTTETQPVQHTCNKQEEKVELKSCSTVDSRQSVQQENLLKAKSSLQEASCIIADGKGYNSLLKANILNKQGNMFMVLGECEKALQEYHESLKSIGQDKLLKTKVLANIAQAKVRLAQAKIRNIQKSEKDPNVETLPSADEQKIIESLRQKAVQGIREAKNGVEELLLQLQCSSVECLSDDYRQERIFALTGLAYLVRDLQKDLETAELNVNMGDLESLKNRLETSLEKELKGNVAIEDTVAYAAKIYLAESYADFADRCSKMSKCDKLVIDKAVDLINSGINNPKVFVPKGFKLWLRDDIPEACKAACSKSYSSPCVRIKPPEACKEVCAETPPLFPQDYHPEWLFYLEWQLGRIYNAQQETKKAIEAYERAVNYLQVTRQTYGSLSQKFGKDAEQFYLQRTDLFLRAARKAVTEREKQDLLQTAIDSIGSRNEKGLQNYFKDECVAENFQGKEEAELQEHEVIFYPSVFDDRLELVLKFSDGSIKQVVNVFPIVTNEEPGIASSKDLVNNVAQFRKLSAQATLLVEKNLLAKKLYKGLINPITNELKKRKIETLIIVPSGKLFSVPFAALRNEAQNDRYLVEDYALAILPSWKLVNIVPANLNKKQAALLNGLIKKAPPELKDLPNVEHQINSVEGILGPYPYSETLLDGDFTVCKLMEKKQAGSKYSILHFATHGEFVEDSQKSLLYTGDGKLTLDDLRDLINGFSVQEQGVELLMLSACETALGTELGMAGTGITAGAQSALGTLWKVEEKSTAVLVTLFYEKWKDKNNPLTKAKALAEAQRSLLKGDSDEVRRLLSEWDKATKEKKTESSPDEEQKGFKNPYYWAGFWMIGNWLK